MTLQRKTPMKRTAMKRSTRRMPWRSAKRESIAGERRDFVERILAERPHCEGPAYLRLLMRMEGLTDRERAIVVVALNDCGLRRRSAEVHEKLKRSRGGSIIDDANVLALDRGCHQFTEDYPRLATLAGMLTPSWRR